MFFFLCLAFCKALSLLGDTAEEQLVLLVAMASASRKEGRRAIESPVTAQRTSHALFQLCHECSDCLLSIA